MMTISLWNLSLELKSKLTSNRYNTITKWLMRYTACVNWGKMHWLKTQSCQLAEYDDLLVRRLIEKLTVLDDKLTIEFRLSAEIDVEI